MNNSISTFLWLGVTAFCGAVLALASETASAGAQNYPTRPVELLVNFGPGGSADLAGRAMGRFLPKFLGVPVPVSNISGASGNTGLTHVANAKPDGYTIGTFTGIAVTTMATGLSRLKMQQFEFLGIADAGTSMFFVGKNSRFKSFQDLLDYAKKHPNKIRVATAGFGTQDDIAVKALTKAGYPMVNVPLKPGERVMATVGGHTDVLFQQVGAVIQLVKSGDLVPIVAFANKPFKPFPNVPIISKFGIDLNLPNWRGLVAPAGTPKDRVHILRTAVRRVLESPRYHKICAAQYKCIKPMNPSEIHQYVYNYYDQITTLMHKLGMGKK